MGQEQAAKAAETSALLLAEAELAEQQAQLKHNEWVAFAARQEMGRLSPNKSPKDLISNKIQKLCVRLAEAEGCPHGDRCMYLHDMPEAALQGDCLLLV